jgi:hypothetical protein
VVSVNCLIGKMKKETLERANLPRVVSHYQGNLKMLFIMV